MKIKVRTILHLKDCKGWEKEVEYKGDTPPQTFRMFPINKRLPLFAPPEPDLPDMSPDVINFIRYKEEMVSINEKFFDHHVYYEEY